MKKLRLSWINLLLGLFTLQLVVACSSFKAERVDNKKSDEKALEITDEWVGEDTERVVQEVIEDMNKHRGFRKYLSSKESSPKIFIAQVQNQTAEAYFPIDDLNDEFLTRLSEQGDFVLVDKKARDQILSEITYQQDGMVDPQTAKKVGKQTGADLMVFGTVFMKPQTRKGKTIKEYSINIHMTDIENGTEVMRVRSRLNKYSEQSGSGW